ncbi:MAG: alpha/beta fold hydrolase [Acidobacteria bacterium]|nr:MAG: alpha/beta fold hydrolase [Acidobacteriota bacterium]REK10511.1 MAG: alpha/beta fold hydrolase [Acidobacteriota bacterium]
MLAHHLLGAPQDMSAAPPLVVLHGLFGSARNWRGVGRRLGERRRVIALDLPNHGASPHSADCSYAAQAAAVAQTLGALDVGPIELMGHSMGGKVAMATVCRQLHPVSRLYVLDIGIRANRPERALLDAMRALPLGEIETRGDAERWLGERVADRATLLFLLTNLVRRGTDDPGEGAFRWQLGLDELAGDFDSIGASPLRPGDRWTGPVHFLGGGESDYLRAADLAALRVPFPEATLDFLPGVGHDVHVEGGEAFLHWVEERS